MTPKTQLILPTVLGQSPVPHRAPLSEDVAMELRFDSARLLFRPLEATDLDLMIALDTDYSLVEGPELPDCEIEIGYMLKKSAWGKGFATEATQRLLAFAFEETPILEVVAVIDPANQASRNVLEKPGLIEEGLRRAHAEQIPGFRITRKQWLDEHA